MTNNFDKPTIPPVAPAPDLPQWVATQAAHRPEAVAVVFQTQQLTYRELDLRANQVAGRLQQLGVGPDMLVGLSIESSLEMIIGLLGILKAGGAFVPLDPTYPTDRLSFLVTESGVSVILTTTVNASHLPSPPAKLVYLDELPDHPPSALDLPRRSSLAACLYTSGSTGQPKGVLLEHSALANHAASLQQAYQLTPADRVLQFAPLNHIAGVEQVLITWLVGACLVLREPKLWMPLDFPAKVQEYGLTVCDLPSGYYQVLVDSWTHQTTPLLKTPLRLMIVGGEVTSPTAVTRWQQSPLQAIRLLNVYGMTEVAGTATLFEVTATPLAERVPIGRPLTGRTTYLLDEQLQPVRAGEVGELHIGGANLACGYLNQPELTQTRFIPDPFSATEDARLYKTGDLARSLPDGNLEYLGRLDHQVSLRGFRIELGEIEGVLKQHSAVQDAAVITQGTGTAQRLVAYVVPPPGELTSPTQNFWQPDRQYRDQAGVLTDPLERLAFKLKQHNLRVPSATRIPLQKPKVDDQFQQPYLARQSYRQFLDKAISLEQFSQFLSCLLQLHLPDTPIPKYRYPSALGLYAVQTYLYLKPGKVAELTGGFYYYHPGAHELELMQPGELSQEVYLAFDQPTYRQAGLALFLVAHLEALTPIYGTHLAREFSLLEAGYLGQLLMTEAPNYGLGLCPIGLLENQDQLKHSLGLTENQVIVHSFLGGAIAPAQTQQWLQPVASQKSPAQLKTELHAYLTAKLPGQMVPDSWVLLEKMPLTPNGKINRQALPAPTDSFVGLVLPRTPLEEIVANLWQEVLKLQQVSVEDNFFEVGGNSLTALQLLTKIQQTFQVELSFQTLLNDGHTVATLATLIATRQPTQTVLPVVAATASLPSPLSADEPLVLSFAQQWFWFLSQFDSQTAAHNMFAAWQLEGSLHLEACRQALVTLVDRQESLRLYFPEANSTGKVQRLPVYDPLTVTDLSEGPAATAAVPLEDLIQEYAQQPFDLSKGPLLRLQLLKLDSRKHLLLLSMHHIIGDAWSLGIFEREWRLLYTAYSQNQTPQLPPLPIQYTDYAAWQHHHLSAEAFQSQLSYWLAQLNDAPELLNLPTDYLRPDRQANQGGLVAWKISTDLTNQLQQLARQHNSTLSMVLFTTFNLLLYRYSGQRDLCVGVPMATRHLRHTEDLIGIFLNMLVLRSRFPQEGTFLDLLTQIKQRMSEAYARSDVPFEYLVRHLKPSRQTNYNPYFQVMFNFVNLPVRPVQELPGLQVTPLHQRFTEMPISNLDLVFTLWETPDGLNGQLLFDKALFREDTIQYLATGFTQLLEQAVRQPETPLRQFTLSEAAMGYYPLTSSQREIWFDQLLHEGVPLYNIGGYVRIDGAIDPQRFEQAVNFLVQKHDTLRTRLSKERDDDGLPLQTYVPTVSVTVPLHDFTGDTAPHEAALAWMQQRFVQPFELYGAPLYRYDLLKVSEDCYYWLMQYHHLIIDGWGIALLTRSLAEIYNQLTAGQSPALTGYSYRDYIENDRTYIDSPQYEKQRQYWLAKYPSPPAPLLFPRYRPTATTHLLGSECHAWYLPRTFYNRLNDLARDQNATLFQLLLGVVYVYFTRTAQREDLVIGLPVLNRANAVFKQTAGLFTGVSAARFEFGTDLTFAQLLSKINQTLKSDYRHQRFPISELQRKIGLPQGRTRLFDVSLSYESHDYDASFDGVDSYTTLLLHPWEQTPLLIFVRDFHTQAAVKLDLVYNLAYFQTAEVVALQTRLEQILQYVLEHPDTMVNRIPLLTASEQAQLLAWNQTQVDYPTDQTIIDLFQTQVEKTPEHVAVVFEGQQLTYRELNAKANQLAHYLMSLGVTTETLVGICVERSLEMVIGLLGILKAGGAYVPLDPAYPEERLQFMLEDSQVQVLLTQQQLGRGFLNLEGLGNLQVVNLDGDWERIATGSEANPVRQSGPAKLAYVIYTSGSTGRPKGVMIEHRALTNVCLDMQHRLSLTAQDKLLALTTLSFDIAGLELYLPLLSGAQMVVLDRETARHGDALANRLAQAHITVMQATPATWQLLVQTGWTPPTSLTVLCGGEALPRTLGQTLLTQGGQFWNVYGPTETTIWSTSHNVTQHPDVPTLLGKPIANTQIYILDANRQSQPLGIPGELCIAGAGLARGYLNRPDLTAEKFLEIDLCGQPTRVYRTGDLARWLPDGNLEYLGRLDYQVKLRGFRIELGEIEATLTQHEVVKEAVVVLQETEKNPQLVAYVTLAGVETRNLTGLEDLSGLTKRLQTWLATRLPDYMIPASITVLEKLPLTPNGKVDRQALPAPDWKPATEQVVPRTETERLLLNLWSQVLGVEITSIQTNFFEAGGHSLLATQLVSRLRDTFQVEMPLRVLFEQPQLQAQAHWLDTQQRHLELPPLLPVAAGSPPVLSFAQQRLWFLAQLEGATATYNIPAALRLVGPLHESALQRAVATLVERHESLRLCFPTVNGQVTVQRLATYNPWSVTDLRHLPASEAARQVMPWLAQQATTPFDLSQGPLFRCQWLRLSDTEHVLLFNQHHIISDGWSLGILFREWNVLYQAYSQGQESPLPALPIQYSDYAAWQRQWLAGEVLEQQLAYWRNHLAGAPALLELPTDLPRPAVTSYQGASLTSTLDAELTRRLTQFSRQQGVTLFMTLLAAFQVLLARYSGQSDIVVGSPIANRTHSHTEDLIGFFVNTLVLRTQVQSDLTFVQLLKAVRETALGAYSHQDLPFEYLVEQLKPPRSLSYSPLFQVMFVLQNTPPVNLELGDLQGSWVDPASTIAKFDLTLSIANLGETLRCDWEYSTELFRPATIQRLTEHFQVLLTGLLHSPEQAVAQLPLLTEAETQQLLAWNQTQTDYPNDQTIVDLFQAQVEKTPDNIAVVFDDQQLTYQELNAKANQLAHYLMTLGVTAETLVGICVERSLEMVIGLLGILKAGGAYVPLDPAYPAERLQFLLEDAAVPVLLSQSQLTERLPVSHATLINMDSLNLTGLTDLSGLNPPRRSGPSNLAYVIYTSGSTGKPKGVMIEHAGLTNLSQAQSQAFELTQRSRVLQFASLNFDASVSELATTLISGATLVLGSTQKILPNDSFVQLINQQAITHVTLPPSFLTAMSPVSLPSLKTLVVAGETCASELVSKWSPGRQFINAYGPTESTVCATLTECASDGNPPPIGKPIANIQIYLLDANQNLTPLGLPGELCIAGAGLARGYLNRPDLTAEKFVELELFGIRQRVYKTGDLARWLPDGNLEYLGRLDHQIKLRGFRIELGEIEAVLTQHEAVKEAVVVLLEKESHPRLAAYVTTRNLTGLSDRSDFTTVLRAWLKIRLPEYMVPTSVTVLEQLPLTPNGKIDRNALFQLSATPALSAGEWVAPRTPEEKLLAEIWTTVLGIERVGIHQNFFDLGGHSLLLIQVQAKVSAAFDQPLSVLELFEYPTIQTLAQHLTATSSKPTLSTRAEHRRTRQTAMRHQRQTRTQHRSKNHD